MDKIENGTVYFIPLVKSLGFDLLYDKYISNTDTKQLIENISTETLESFLYKTAKFFYGFRKLNGGETK
ncbi:MAG TPA: hypothetical protein DEB10_13140 [Ruminococcaceae bacterium]|jgi:hypothetical protein|nr:hypothetical protein [Oscillospiraceae bacterium]